MPLSFEQKSPEDLMVRRVDGKLRRLAVSATVVAATALTAVLIVTAIVAVAVTRPVTGSDVHHRLARRRSVNHPRRAIRHHWRAVNHRRRTTGSRDDDGWREPDRSREGDADRPTRLRRGGEPSDRNHCYQTEEMFCSHARFDGVFRRFFNGQKRWQVSGFKMVSEKKIENE